MKKATRPRKPLTDDGSEYVAQVHGRTRKDVERYSRKLTDRNAADAEDLTQETYTLFSARVGKHGPLEEERPEKPYLMLTAKNTLRNQRSRNRLPVTPLKSETETGDAHQDIEASRVVGKKEYQKYASAVRRSTYLDRFKELLPIIQSKLTADEWQLISYRWVDGLPFEEIAAITGQPRDQVAYRVSRATQRARYYADVLLSRQHTD